MQRMKFGKIQKFSIAIKIKPKIESFDHSGHAKDEIWQNPEIFSHAENLAKKESVEHSEPAKDEIWQNPEKFWFVLKIWLKNEIFDHSGPVKEEIWQHPEILSHFENLV